MSLLCAVKGCPNPYTVWVRTDGLSCGLCNEHHFGVLPKTTKELYDRILQR